MSFDAPLSRTEAFTAARANLAELVHPGALPDLGAPISEVGEIPIFAAMKTREDYVRWVADFGVAMTEFAFRVRQHKFDRRSSDIERQAKAQSEAASISYFVTEAILMRRLSKRWAAAQKEIALKAVAEQA